jgi:hypothetical protein
MDEVIGQMGNLQGRKAPARNLLVINWLIGKLGHSTASQPQKRHHRSANPIRNTLHRGMCENTKDDSKDGKLTPPLSHSAKGSIPTGSLCFPFGLSDESCPGAKDRRCAGLWRKDDLTCNDLTCSRGVPIMGKTST